MRQIFDFESLMIALNLNDFTAWGSHFNSCLKLGVVHAKNHDPL